MADKDGRSPSGRAVAATPSSPQAVSPLRASIPSAVADLIAVSPFRFGNTSEGRMILNARGDYFAFVHVEQCGGGAIGSAVESMRRKDADRLLEALNALHDLVAATERTERNRDMWKAQCERQAAELDKLRRALGDIADFRTKKGGDAATVQWNRAGQYASAVARSALYGTPHPDPSSRFIDAIHEATPNGEWVDVQHHPNGDWSVGQPAQAIEARRAETQSGSVEDESAVPEGNAP